jgi:hypothetical protein
LESWLIYGPFDLTHATEAEVTFQRWQRTQEDHDYFYWMVSTDGQHYWGWRDDGVSGGWVDQTFDLTSVHHLGDVTGRSDLWLGFLQTSDATVNDKGVFLDKVKIRALTSAVSASSGTSETSGRLLPPKANLKPGHAVLSAN